ncbi:unnamed protein product, partial [Mesorhabditis spiculigera]
MSHSGSDWAKDKNEEDRVEKLIKKSGCWDGHIAVVDCMGDKRDWRQCQEQLTNFRTCMTKNYLDKKRAEDEFLAQLEGKKK